MPADNHGIEGVLVHLMPEIAAAVTGAAVVQWVGWGGVALMILFVIVAEVLLPFGHQRD